MMELVKLILKIAVIIIKKKQPVHFAI